MPRYLRSPVHRNIPRNQARRSRLDRLSEDTLSAYLPRIERFKIWCSKKYPNVPEDQRYIVTGQKLETYLTETVIDRTALFDRNHTTPRKIKHKSVDTYVNATMHLYYEQLQAGINNNPCPRKYIDPFLKRLKQRDRRLDQLENQMRQGVTVEQAEDLASDTHVEPEVERRRIGDDHVKSLVLQLCQDDKSPGEQLRNVLSLSLYRILQLHGDSIRNSFLGDLQCIEIEENEYCYPVLGFFKKDEDSSSSAQVGFAGCLRNKNPLICPFAAMGMYMFWRFHVANEPFPDLLCTQLMRMVRVLRTSELSTQSCTQPAMEEMFAVAMLSVGISLSEFGCIYRISGPEIADVGAMSETQFRSIDGACLAQQNINAMREAAGFADSEAYYIPRSQVAPPAELCRKLFPDVNSGLVNVCQSAGGFFRLVMALKRTFLQDAAVIQGLIPSHPIWQHEIFMSSVYLDFKRRVQNAPARNPAAVNRVYTIADELAKEVKLLQEQFSAQFRQQRDKLESLEESVCDGLRKLDVIQQRNPHLTLTSVQDMHHMLLLQAALTNATNIVTSDAYLLPGAEAAPTPVVRPSPEPRSSSETVLETSVPQHFVSRNVSTIVDIFKEYTEGFEGGPALEQLERMYGTAWRKNSKNSWYFNKRLRIIRIIKSLAAQKRISEQQAADLLERWRHSNGRSMWWVYENVKSTNDLVGL